MRSKKYFFCTAVLFLLFAAFTLAVSLIDIRAVGSEGSYVGMAGINSFVFEHTGFNATWYKLTELLGVFALAIALGFALLGLVQFIRRKSLFKVDYQLLLLGAFYAVVIAAYIFFEHAVINYRPVILEGELEASYPSSHTMLIICIVSTAISELKRLLSDKKQLCFVLCMILSLVCVLTVVGRLLAGVHWLTDILGGVILSAALVMTYRSFVTFAGERRAASGQLE